MSIILEKLTKKTLDNKIEWQEGTSLIGFSCEVYQGEASYIVKVYYNSYKKSHVIEVDNYTVLFLTDDEYYNLRTIIQNSINERNEIYNAQKVAKLTKILEEL